MQDYYEPKIGEKAPDFDLPSTDGSDVSISDFRKKWVVLYFYPKDDTPGCTAEACSFRDYRAELRKEGAEILGVSTDSLESHEKFREKYDLRFPLLSDSTADIAKMYGAWGEKNFYGRRSWGVKRITFLIGPDGRIRKIYRKVDAKTHGETLLNDLRELKKEK
ncbi:MAG: thioredoxin-dependent thiol peroxidase [Acidobacteria bacterium]|nr:thioredoxin-dependent thiol peroxidase [Acidobacteriota bacterium]